MKGLDKWLTTEPEDEFTPFWEAVMELIPEKLYDENEEWFNGKECEDIIFTLYQKGYSPEDIAIRFR